MSGFEDGSWEKPLRPRRREEFIPLEEVSVEDLHPGYDIGPRTPEEELLAREHEDELEHAEGNAGEEEAMERHAAKLEVSLDDEEYSWEKAEKDAEYESYLDRLSRDINTMDDRGENWVRLKNRYYLDTKMTPAELNRRIEGRVNRSEDSHGGRGREKPRKHKKGLESIRRTLEEREMS